VALGATADGKLPAGVGPRRVVRDPAGRGGFRQGFDVGPPLPDERSGVEPCSTPIPQPAEESSLMKRSSLYGVAAVVVLAGSFAVAQTDPTHKGTGTPGKQDMPAPPPGMTEADMQACMEAGTPGAQHAFLAEAIGTWQGKCTHWMTPEAPPVSSEMTSTVSAMLDGRFTKCEMKGDMPGMGPFSGYGVSGFDNVSQKFVSTWMDNCSTGIMNGTGELSADGKTLTWNFTYNCPITKKAMVMREIERRTGKDAVTLEMFGTDPKSGKEFKMMEIAMTRKGASQPVGAR
jgi:hypothetical protein